MTKKEIIKTLVKVNIKLAIRLGAAEGEEARFFGNMCGDLTTAIEALCDEIEEPRNAG